MAGPRYRGGIHGVRDPRIAPSSPGRPRHSSRGRRCRRRWR
jgi:hypothetical protein